MAIRHRTESIETRIRKSVAQSQRFAQMSPEQKREHTRRAREAALRRAASRHQEDVDLED